MITAVWISVAIGILLIGCGARQCRRPSARAPFLPITAGIGFLTWAGVIGIVARAL